MSLDSTRGFISTIDLLWRLFFAFVILYYNYSLGGVYSPIGLWLVSVVFCTIWHCSTENDTVLSSQEDCRFVIDFVGLFAPFLWFLWWVWFGALGVIRLRDAVQHCASPVQYRSLPAFHSVNIFHANSGINRLKFPSLDFLFPLSRCNTVSAPKSSQVPIPAGLATCNSFFPGTPCSFVGLIALSFHPSFIHLHHISLSLRCCRTRNLFSLLTAAIE